MNANKRPALRRHPAGVPVEFRGIYRDAMVFVNGDFAGQRPYVYSTIEVVLDPFLKYGQENEIRVEARAHEDSRWYRGLGIHRDVFLTVATPRRRRHTATHVESCITVTVEGPAVLQTLGSARPKREPPGELRILDGKEKRPTAGASRRRTFSWSWSARSWC